MELLKRLKESIGWIGGSLAALTAMCYAAGYLSYHAHLTMLGLDGTVDFPHEQMLLEGTHFAFVVGRQLLLGAMVLGMAGALLLGAGRALLSVGMVERAASRLRVAVARWPTVVLVVWMSLGCSVALWHSERFFYPLQDVSSIDNQLFSRMASAQAASRCLASDDARLSQAEIVSRALRAGPACGPARRDEFLSLVNGFLLLLLALGAALAGSFAAAFPLGAPVIRALTAVYALVYLLMLPLGFGVLVREPVHPVVQLDLKGGATMQGFLVARNDRGLTLWRPAERVASWFPAEAVGTIRTFGQESLFPVRKEPSHE